MATVSHVVVKCSLYGSSSLRPGKFPLAKLTVDILGNESKEMHPNI